jgi:hypothetical protein
VKQLKEALLGATDSRMMKLNFKLGKQFDEV